jgi:hypothetical protein
MLLARRKLPIRWPSLKIHNNMDREKGSGHAGQPVQYLNSMSHGLILSSTYGEPEFVVQEFFEIPASPQVSQYRPPEQKADYNIHHKVPY